MAKFMSKALYATCTAGLFAVAAMSTLFAHSDSGEELFPKNERGLSFGSAAAAFYPEDEPDLIMVESTSGLEGYVYRDDLDEVTGVHMPSPEEAIKWQRQTAGTTVVLPVYESDGTTRIGEFVIQRPTLVEIENSVKDFPELGLDDG